MEPIRFFRHCPSCGRDAETPPPSPPLFRCGQCGFRYFFNPTVAVAVFVRRRDDRALFIRRAQDPGRGRLAPPGGFVDIGETAEAAARREIREEVGLELTELEFLVSAPNEYLYADVTYPVLDLFFTGRTLQAEGAIAQDEVAQCVWLEPLEVSPDEMAFPSMRHALIAWQSRLGR